MVLNVGRAKNMSSLINGDTAGGIKKQGLPSTIGRVASINNVFANRIGCSLNCPIILGQGFAVYGCMGCLNFLSVRLQSQSGGLKDHASK